MRSCLGYGIRRCPFVSTMFLGVNRRGPQPGAMCRSRKSRCALVERTRSISVTRDYSGCVAGDAVEIDDETHSWGDRGRSAHVCVIGLMFRLITTFRSGSRACPAQLIRSSGSCGDPLGAAMRFDGSFPNRGCGARARPRADRGHREIVTRTRTHVRSTLPCALKTPLS